MYLHSQNSLLGTTQAEGALWCKALVNLCRLWCWQTWFRNLLYRGDYTVAWQKHSNLWQLIIHGGFLDSCHAVQAWLYSDYSHSIPGSLYYMATFPFILQNILKHRCLPTSTNDINRKMYGQSAKFELWTSWVSRHKTVRAALAPH